MFNPNFIAEPGIQKETSDANWSYLQKKTKVTSQKPETITVQNNKNIKAKWAIYIWSASVILVIASIGLVMNSKPNISLDMVLNQVVDLIIESGYYKDLQ